MANDRAAQHAYLEKILLNAQGVTTLTQHTATALATELLDNGVEVTVPLPPEPPVFSLVKIGNGDIWIRTTSGTLDNWLLVDGNQTDTAGWTDLLAYDPKPFYPPK
jgi:hypothetical protein